MIDNLLFAAAGFLAGLVAIAEPQPRLQPVTECAGCNPIEQSDFASNSCGSVSVLVQVATGWCSPDCDATIPCEYTVDIEWNVAASRIRICKQHEGGPLFCTTITDPDGTGQWDESGYLACGAAKVWTVSVPACDLTAMGIGECTPCL